MPYFHRLRNRIWGMARTILVFLLLYINISALCQSSSYELHLGLDGIRSTCDKAAPSIFTVTTGSIADIMIFVRPVSNLVPAPEYKGITDFTWPSCLSVEFGYLGDKNSFDASPRLFEELSPEYYLPGNLIANDSLWRTTGYVPNSVHRLPEYNLRLYFPSHLAGEHIWIRVNFDRSDVGNLQTMKDLKIFAPCSEADERAIGDSFVNNAYKERNYRRVVAIAESLQVGGWKSKLGFLRASFAAHHEQDYGAELFFVDCCYQEFGNLQVIGHDHDNDYDQDFDKALAKSHYDSERGRILELIRNQQQQR